MSLFGPLFNKQNPSVTSDDIIAASLFIKQDGNVYSSFNEKLGSFEDVEWGHGASGMLFIKSWPISKEPVSIDRINELRTCRRKLAEMSGLVC